MFREIGKRIRMLREDRNLTLKEIANIIGVSEATFSRYESGHIENIPLSKIEKIAKALNTTPGYLMGWIEKKENIITIHEFTNALEAMKFILEQPALMAYGGYDLEKLSDEDIIDIANDLLYAVKLSAERHKRKDK